MSQNLRVVARLAAIFSLVFALSLAQGWAISINEGSTATGRANQDTAAGQVYIYNGGVFPTGETVSFFNWFGPAFAGTIDLTPLLFSVSGGQFTVQAIGATESVTNGTFSSSNAFGLQVGTNVTGTGWTFGFIEALANSSGGISGATAGGVQFNSPIDGGTGVGGGGTTNDWVFTPSSDTITTVALGTTFGSNGTFALNNPALGGFNVDRTYSANAGPISGVAEPGTFSLITGAGLVLAGLFRYRSFRGRRKS